MRFPVLGSVLTVPSALQRRLYTSRPRPWGTPTPWSTGVHKFDEETWVSWDPISLHEDQTRFGLATYGVVLVNEGRYKLVYDDTIYPMQVGQTFRINARWSHGVLADDGYLGEWGACFAFMAWDMEYDTPMQKFYKQIIPAIATKAQCTDLTIAVKEPE